jgi:hypothetical protein
MHFNFLFIKKDFLINKKKPLKSLSFMLFQNKKRRDIVLGLLNKIDGI